MRRLTGHDESDPGARERRTGIAPNGKPYESVWDYPRPPVLDPVEWHVRVVHQGRTIVDAPRAVRVLETSQPPAYYIDPAFVDLDALVGSDRQSYCEWKGMAQYASISTSEGLTSDAAWTYPEPTAAFTSITGYWAFYAQSLESCSIDGEVVSPNPGSFYGGWMTTQVTGPVKGAAGTLHW